MEVVVNGNSFNGDLGSVVEWLNSVVPGLDLPMDASLEELRLCLKDGTVLYCLLDVLCPGSVDPRDGSGFMKLKRFLVAMEEMGLPGFVMEDLQQGNMEPVLQCLRTLKAQFGYSYLMDDTDDDDLRSRCNDSMPPQEDHSVISEASIREWTASNRLDKASTWTLFDLINNILDESIGRKDGHAYHMACLLKKVVQLVEQRVSTQAKNLKDQNNFYTLLADKYHAKIRAFETLAAGTAEEFEVILSQLQWIKVEKTKIEEKEKLEVQNLSKLKEEKSKRDNENSTLRTEIEAIREEHVKHCIQLKKEAEETKTQLVKKIIDLENLSTVSSKRVKELESFTESKSKRWRKREGAYKRFIDYQCRSLRELRESSESIKHVVLKTQQLYSEEFKCLGTKLKGLTDAAESYHSVLAENRRLYNEIQDLKGNIRVYCRIRPFLPGQIQKQTAIEYIGDNGELVVSNPLKQGNDHRLFKFNKVFSPQSSQEEVFLDTQPLIRSVLDGYNVCIFAYGQTGSGKTYTMSGPNLSTKEDWGVNYRALHDLFEISQTRRSSISYEVGVQMVEIYNEQVRDLLVSNGSQKRLEIWSKTQPNGLAVPDASMHRVTSTTDVLELMEIGLLNRAVGATALNERSSRSHSVLTVHVRGMELKTGAILRGSLHLVDLAGSERVDRSEVKGDRLREAQHINKSLSALGDVISALAQKSSHVPYRNSKLTQVLQSSLGGQAKTLMFVQLNPDVDSFLETISTLKFAERVSGVELGAARSNKEGKDLKDLLEQVASLRDTIASKDEELERLRQITGAKPSTGLPEFASSPRRHLIGTPRRSPSPTRGKESGYFQKASFDMDNSSESSGGHSEAGSVQSKDDLQHPKKLFLQSKSMVDLRHEEFLPEANLAGSGVGLLSNEDVDLSGFDDADSNDRLSDISDGGLSMGTETDGSRASAMEFALFPEYGKPTKVAKASAHKYPTTAASRTSLVESTEKRQSFVSKPPQKAIPPRLPRASLIKSSSSKVFTSTPMSAPKKGFSASSSSASSTSKRRH